MQKNRAFFLDRDGVIIRDVPYLRTESAIQLLPGVDKAIRKVNVFGFICIVITNQSGVAHGLLNTQDISNIHDVIQSELALKGSNIDAFYFCPHHPDGSVKEYAIECDCRKPGVGLFFRAAEDYNLDLTKSVMVGDKETDLRAGRSAGCESFILNKPMLINEIEITFSNLEEVVDHVIHNDQTIRVKR